MLHITFSAWYILKNKGLNDHISIIHVHTFNDDNLVTM